ARLAQLAVERDGHRHGVLRAPIGLRRADRAGPITHAGDHVEQRHSHEWRSVLGVFLDRLAEELEAPLDPLVAEPVETVPPPEIEMVGLEVAGGGLPDARTLVGPPVGLARRRRPPR